MTRGARVGLMLVLTLSVGLLAACNSNSADDALPAIHKFVDTKSAKNAATVALSTLETAAPGGKLLGGETVARITATGTPMWQFLVGSPKDNSVYVVLVNNGRAQWRQWGSVTMKTEEWSKVPTMTAWKVDSDAARTKALALHPEGKNAKYSSSFMTYLPEAAVDKPVVPMQWVISFGPLPKGSKAPTSTVIVDMVTGAASFAKAPPVDKKK